MSTSGAHRFAPRPPFFAVLPLLLGASPAQGQAPPETYVDEGACPFECCTYGDWTAVEEAALRAAPESDAPAVGRVQAGQMVRAEDGLVRSRPTPFVWKRSREPSSDRRVHQPGDTVWILTYLGEGRFTVWEDGEVFMEDLGFSPYGGTWGTRCEECDHGFAVREIESEWWVRIRTPDGTVGWSDRTSVFLGKDLCGM